MKMISMVRDVLVRLQSGEIMARIFSVTVRLAGAAFALAALVSWLGMWIAVFAMEGGAMFGGFLAQLIALLGCAVTVAIFWVRGEDIRQSAAPDFVVLPAVVVLFRMMGELYATATATVAFALSVMLFMGSDVSSFGDAFQSLASPASGLIASVGLCIAGLVGSVFWLALFYGLAESLNLSLTIAKSTRGSYDVLQARLRTDAIETDSVAAVSGSDGSGG
jgi:hypothetical protein